MLPTSHVHALRASVAAEKCTSSAKRQNYDELKARESPKEKRITDLQRRSVRRRPERVQCTQQDPIGLAGGLNLYGYANGDPVNYSDPFGLKAEASGDSTAGDGAPDAKEGEQTWGQYVQQAGAVGQAAGTALVGGVLWTAGGQLLQQQGRQALALGTQYLDKFFASQVGSALQVEDGISLQITADGSPKWVPAQPKPVSS